MHARTRELLQHLDAAFAVFRDALAAIPAAQRDARPAPGVWSAANVMSHLARTEGQVAAFLQRALQRALADDALPPASDETPVLATMAVAQQVLDRTTPIAAPDFAQPDAAQTAADALSAFETVRTRTRQVLLAGDGLDTTGLVRAHFALGELTFEQWIAFVGLHQRRHAAQLCELAERLAAG